MINTFLGEARKNPELNVRVSAFQQIIDAGYNTSEYFLTFTNIKKVGINPSSGFDTPNGIYTYPVKEILPTLRGSMDNVPFANEAPYIHILKKKGSGILDPVERYNNSDLKRDIKKIKDIIKKSSVGHSEAYIQHFDNVMTDAYNSSFKKTAVSRFWNITKEISADRDFSAIMGWGGSKASSFKDFYDPKDEVELVDDRKNNRQVKKRKDRSKRKGVLNLKSGVAFNSQGWNNLLRMMGYNGFVDRNATGTIHVNEPLQAVFMSTKAFTVVDSIANKSYERLTRQGKYTEEITALRNRHNSVAINGVLRGKAEEALNEILDSDVAEANIDFYDGKFFISGDKGNVEKANFRSSLINISDISINGGYFRMGNIMKDVVIYKGEFVELELDNADIIGGTFHNCMFPNVKTISNGDLRRCRFISNTMLFNCNLDNCNMQDCGFTGSGVRNGFITRSILDDPKMNVYGGCTMDQCKINAGTYDMVRIERCTIKGGTFDTCRMSDTNVKDGTFTKIKVSSNVNIEGGDWSETL